MPPRPTLVQVRDLAKEVERLCVSAMVRTMADSRGPDLFQPLPHGLLFRGHSHAPQLLRQETGKIVSEAILPDQEINLADRLPCVVTCGALVDGLCIWYGIRKRGGSGPSPVPEPACRIEIGIAIGIEIDTTG